MRAFRRIWTAYAAIAMMMPTALAAPYQMSGHVRIPTGNLPRYYERSTQIFRAVNNPLYNTVLRYPVHSTVNHPLYIPVIKPMYNAHGTTGVTTDISPGLLADSFPVYIIGGSPAQRHSPISSRVDRFPAYKQIRGASQLSSTGSPPGSKQVYIFSTDILRGFHTESLPLHKFSTSSSPAGIIPAYEYIKRDSPLHNTDSSSGSTKVYTYSTENSPRGFNSEILPSNTYSTSSTQADRLPVYKYTKGTTPVNNNDPARSPGSHTVYISYKPRSPDVERIPFYKYKTIYSTGDSLGPHNERIPLYIYSTAGDHTPTFTYSPDSTLGVSANKASRPRKGSAVNANSAKSNPNSKSDNDPARSPSSETVYIIYKPRSPRVESIPLYNYRTVYSTGASLAPRSERHPMHIYGTAGEHTPTFTDSPGFSANEAPHPRTDSRVNANSADSNPNSKSGNASHPC